MLTFFIMSSLEGWSSIMFDATNTVNYDVAMQE